MLLVKERDVKGHPTLGIFRPRKIDSLIITPDKPDWSPKQRAILEQGHLFAEKLKHQLEKIPFKFQYKFYCDDDTCPSHTIICTDWEMAESWRSWKTQYGNKWEEKFRQRFEKEMIEKYDTHFFVGTIHQHPGTWIIVGLFYPPRITQPSFKFPP